MNLTRALWLRSLTAGLAIMIVPAGGSTLWAQGPDPFRPYNRQYDPYTVPMAPPGAEAGQFVGGMPRSGIRGANQYQSYLGELQAPGREPYYRSSVDPNYDPKGTREYRPNRDADRTYEQSQALITQKYLAYFSERDPKKRAALLKDYNRTRSKVERALSTRRENQTRILEAATTEAERSERRRSAATADLLPRLPATDRTPRTSVTDSTRRESTRAVPPPPPLFGGSSSRGIRTPRTPEDVLKRSRRLNPANDAEPGRGEAAGTLPTRDRRTTPELPLPE